MCDWLRRVGLRCDSSTQCSLERLERCGTTNTPNADAAACKSLDASTQFPSSNQLSRCLSEAAPSSDGAVSLRVPLKEHLQQLEDALAARAGAFSGLRANGGGISSSRTLPALKQLLAGSGCGCEPMPPVRSSSSMNALLAPLVRALASRVKANATTATASDERADGSGSGRRRAEAQAGNAGEQKPNGSGSESQEQQLALGSELWRLRALLEIAEQNGELLVSQSQLPQDESCSAKLEMPSCFQSQLTSIDDAASELSIAALRRESVERNTGTLASASVGASFTSFDNSSAPSFTSVDLSSISSRVRGASPEAIDRSIRGKLLAQQREESSQVSSPMSDSSPSAGGGGSTATPTAAWPTAGARSIAREARERSDPPAVVFAPLSVYTVTELEPVPEVTSTGGKADDGSCALTSSKATSGSTLVSRFSIKGLARRRQFSAKRRQPRALTDSQQQAEAADRQSGSPSPRRDFADSIHSSMSGDTATGAPGDTLHPPDRMRYNRAPRRSSPAPAAPGGVGAGGSINNSHERRDRDLLRADEIQAANDERDFCGDPQTDAIFREFVRADPTGALASAPGFLSRGAIGYCCWSVGPRRRPLQAGGPTGAGLGGVGAGVGVGVGSGSAGRARKWITYVQSRSGGGSSVSSFSTSVVQSKPGSFECAASFQTRHAFDSAGPGRAHSLSADRSLDDPSTSGRTLCFSVPSVYSPLLYSARAAPPPPLQPAPAAAEPSASSSACVSPPLLPALSLSPAASAPSGGAANGAPPAAASEDTPPPQRLVGPAAPSALEYKPSAHAPHMREIPIIKLTTEDEDVGQI